MFTLPAAGDWGGRYAYGLPRALEWQLSPRRRRESADLRGREVTPSPLSWSSANMRESFLRKSVVSHVIVCPEPCSLGQLPWPRPDLSETQILMGGGQHFDLTSPPGDPDAHWNLTGSSHSVAL